MTNTNIKLVLEKAIEEKASDIFIIAGCPVSFKIADKILPLNEEKLYPQDTEALLREIYTIGCPESPRDINILLADGDDDFSFSVPSLGRFRCNSYKQRNSLAAVIRVLTFEMPDPEALHIPEVVTDLSKKEKGMVLITGSAGSGKSTTLAAIIDRINETRNCHIITIEDPIEYIHRHKKSIVSQRELSTDTLSFVKALRAALRQAPDIILLGEMRDYETISTAVTAAETGQLVFSTLHTIGAANTIDRIIDVFPESQQQQIRIQLSTVLEAVVSQQLVPTVDGKLIPAFEIMFVNPAIRNMIREKKTHQIDNVIALGAQKGMRTMDSDLLRLFKEGVITRDTALTYCTNTENMIKRTE